MTPSLQEIWNYVIAGVKAPEIASYLGLECCVVEALISRASTAYANGELE